MEPLFENQYTHSEKYFSEYLGYFYFKKPLFIVLNCLFALAFVIGILSLVLPQIIIDHQIIAIYTAVPIIVWALRIVRFIRAKRLTMKRKFEVNHGKPLDVMLSVTENEIEVIASTGAKNTIAFSQIKKTVKTKNLCMLITQAKLAVVFCQDSFTKGTFDEFRQFLIAKGFKA